VNSKKRPWYAKVIAVIAVAMNAVVGIAIANIVVKTMEPNPQIAQIRMGK